MPKPPLTSGRRRKIEREVWSVIDALPDYEALGLIAEMAATTLVKFGISPKTRQFHEFKETFELVLVERLLELSSNSKRGLQ